MEYFFTDTQKTIQELAYSIAVERIKPWRARLDEEERFPHELMQMFAHSDLFGITIPEEYGGLGMTGLDSVLAIEQIARVCIGFATTYSACSLGAYPILLYGDHEIKKKYLPDIAKGIKYAAFALTEPNAGSDVAGIQTTAVRDGDYYVLNGTKQWITNGGDADIYTVIAITNRAKGPRGASAFVVEKGDVGFRFGKKEKKLGIRSSSTRELIFNNCRISADRLINREGMGFIIAMKTFDKSRPGVGALGLGLSQGALDIACQFARQRKQFGQPIMSFQAIQHMLADMATEIEASRALIYAVARFVDSNHKDVSKEVAMVKIFPTDTAMRVTTNAVQVLGGHGYMRDYPVEKMMRDAKILQIYEGTNQIQRNIIGQALNKEYARNKENFI